MSTISLRRSNPCIDEAIRPLCEALWANGVETCWSCEGAPGHLCARPTIVICGDFLDGLEIIEKVKAAMDSKNIQDYWLSEVHLHPPTSSGISHYWLLEIVNPRRDYIAFPIARR